MAGHKRREEGYGSYLPTSSAQRRASESLTAATCAPPRPPCRRRPPAAGRGSALQTGGREEGSLVKKATTLPRLGDLVSRILPPLPTCERGRLVDGEGFYCLAEVLNSDCARPEDVGAFFDTAMGGKGGGVQHALPFSLLRVHLPSPPHVDALTVRVDAHEVRDRDVPLVGVVPRLICCVAAQAGRCGMRTIACNVGP